MLLTLGVVLLLGQRTGYWSAEALVGGELLLLALAAGTFVANNVFVTWRAPTMAAMVDWWGGRWAVCWSPVLVARWRSWLSSWWRWLACSC